MPILGDFAIKYGKYANELGVPLEDLWQALVDTAENTVRFQEFSNVFENGNKVIFFFSLRTGIRVSHSE